VANAVRGQGVVAVSFSGGLDSSLLVACAMKMTKVVACTAAVEGAPDSARARAAAARLGVELVVTRLTEEGVRREIESMQLPFEPTAMDASLWTLYSVVARSASERGAKVLLLGQLADELFGGYAKYRTALLEGGEERAAEAMIADVEAYAARGRIRDVSACSRWLEPVLPFESNEVKELGLAFPLSFKISGTATKLVLRRAATLLGLPEELSGTPKKAAQYSSGIQKVVLGTSLFNSRQAPANHDSITATEGEAGGFQTTSGEVQLLRP
jgi:asparagine synthase (glutamine-hydrolysing)